MRVFWQNDEEVKPEELTVEQWSAIGKAHTRWKLSDTVKIMPGIDYILIDVGTMILGIEKDGHTHS